MSFQGPEAPRVFPAWGGDERLTGPGSLLLCHQGDLGLTGRAWAGLARGASGQSRHQGPVHSLPEHRGALMAAGRLPPRQLGLTLPAPQRASPGPRHRLPGSRPAAEDPPRLRATWGLGAPPGDGVQALSPACCLSPGEAFLGGDQLFRHPPPGPQLPRPGQNGEKWA